MTDITPNEKQRAIKISQALQDFFDKNPGTHTLRSAEAYEISARKGLAEIDRHGGVKFREFLNKLKKANALNFIPQCRPEPGNGNMTNWIFQSAASKTIRLTNPSLRGTEQTLHEKTETESKLSAIKDSVEALSKRNPNDFDFIALQTRQTYPRAYEYWSVKEEKLLLEAASVSDDTFELSKIFGRQPSAIENKLKNLTA